MLLRLAFFFIFAAFCRADPPIPGSCRQVILVTSAGWKSSDAEMRMFSKSERGWNQVGPAMPALTGRNGMAWGIGLHKPAASGPVKREGDGCAPAGVFTFGKAFSQKPVRLNIPCVTITPNHEGVDDPDSRFYNRFVDRAKIERPDWKTSEKFFASPHYSLGIWVNHNTAAKKGGGSCIYIHEWVGERTGTAGCTVLRRADLDRFMRFLNQKASPVLVQLPKAQAAELFPELSSASH